MYVPLSLVLGVKAMDCSLDVNEWELCAFFGNEHVSRVHGEDWYDSDSLYEVNYDDGTKLSSAIHPVHNDVRITVTLNGEVTMDWHGVGLNKISYIEEKDKTFLRLIGVNGHTLELKVNPSLKIEEKVGGFYT